jgi:hypothetical protein
MSPVLPFDIIALIIDIVGENKDTNFLREFALVSHSFLQICRKHLFATVELQDQLYVPKHDVAFPKKGFVKLLKNRPDMVKYIRNLTYKVSIHELRSPACARFHRDHLLSPILLPNFLRTIPRLSCLKINGFTLDWNRLNSSLTSAFLHLMHLPTINHIDLSFIQNFPLSSLTSSVNLYRLDICHMTYGEDGSFEIVQSKMLPKIREFNTSESELLTTKLFHAKRQDGRPAFNFMDLKRLSMSFTWSEDEQYVLQNAKLLEELHLSIGRGPNSSLVGLHDIFSPTLKVLDLTVDLYDNSPVFLPLQVGGLCEELEALAGYNMLEALSFEVQLEVDGLETEDFIGSIIQKVEGVLVKPGWSALRQVSLKVSFWPTLTREDSKKLFERLQSLPDKYLSNLSKLESVAFNYSVEELEHRLTKISNYHDLLSLASSFDM